MSDHDVVYLLVAPPRQLSARRHQQAWFTPVNKNEQHQESDAEGTVSDGGNDQQIDEKMCSQTKTQNADEGEGSPSLEQKQGK